MPSELLANCDSTILEISTKTNLLRVEVSMKQNLKIATFKKIKKNFLTFSKQSVNTKTLISIRKSQDDGPYTYVKGSHLNGPLRRLKQSISQVMPKLY